MAGASGVAPMPVGQVVCEGMFQPPPRLLVFKGNTLGVQGTALVQIVRRSDGAFVLRLSQVRLWNPQRVRLRVLLWLRDPLGGRRKLKNKWLDTYGDPVWMSSCGEGVWRVSRASQV